MSRYRKPLSVIIAEEIKKKIAQGIYRQKQQLPAEVELARDLGISRATLREALSMLDRQGYVTRIHGVGSFVAKPEKQIDSSLDKLESMMELIRRSGYEATMKVLTTTRKVLDQESCTVLEIPEGSRGIEFTTLYSANKIPFVYTREIIAESLVPDVHPVSRSDSEDLADFIAKNTGKAPVATLTHLKGILPTKDLIEILMIDAHSPIIRQRFTLFNKQKKPVGCGQDYFNSSWFEFSIYTNTIRL
jgi:GntR family transcriptional regulator